MGELYADRKIIEDWRQLKKACGLATVTLTNGCFDILHPGHVHKLELAAKLSELLVVSIDADRAVRKAKGPGRPFMPWRDRARVVASLCSVDYVTVHGDDRLFYADGSLPSLIRYLHPTAWAAREDKLPAHEQIAAHDAGSVIYRIPRFGTYSSTAILESRRHGVRPSRRSSVETGVEP